MQYKILSLLDENDFISGEKIAETLGVSRTAVWKNINRLKTEGYKIESSTKKGYHLIKENYPYNKFEITRNLNTSLIAKECIFYEETGSSNEEAKKISNIKVTDGLCVVADMQTSGKGRLGRVWQSPKGKNIYFSICLVPNITPMEAPQITLMAGIAVCRAINDSFGLSAKIKWPNDIIVNNKKICGILTEISAEIDSIKYIVCGIGINANVETFSDELKNKATSLKLELNCEIDRAAFLCSVLKKIEYYYDIFLKSNGISGFIDEYRLNCINIGQNCTALFKGSSVSGIVKDIDDNGNLILEKENGERLNIFSGEVTLRRCDGSYI